MARRKDKADTKKRKRQRQPPKDWKARFLAVLASSANVRASCEAAKISRQVAYDTRKNDKTFRAAWTRALAESCDLLELAARSRAVDGVQKTHTHYYKGSACGQDVITEYSDTLLIFLLKAHRPEKYRERHEVKHKNAGITGPLSITFEVVAKDGNGPALPSIPATSPTAAE